MNTPTITITNEQINSLPLLLGIIEEMGIRPLIDAHLIPHGQWEGASVGTVISIWLCHLLQERDHRLVVVRDWVHDHFPWGRRSSPSQYPLTQQVEIRSAIHTSLD